MHGSGIDIAIGNQQAAGGILLRSIERLQPKPVDKKEQYTFGPLNVLTELVSGFNNCFNGEPNVFALVMPGDNGIELEKVDDEKIVQCDRIGLSPKDPTFHKSQYRYLIHPHLPHKEKTNIALALMEKWGRSTESLDKIKQMLGSEFLKEYW